MFISLPLIGGAFALVANGPLGALIGALILGFIVVFVLSVAAFLETRRLPIHLVVTPDPTPLNNVVSPAWVQVDKNKRIYAVALWCHLTANNYGNQAHRITGLIAEFSRLKWGFWLNKVAEVRCEKQMPNETNIDWSLPPAGQPQTRRSNFVSQPQTFNKRLDMAEVLQCRIIVEIGSPTRRVYVRFPEEIELMT